MNVDTVSQQSVMWTREGL